MSKVKPKKTDSAVTVKTTKSTLNQKKKKSGKKKIWKHTQKEPLSKDQVKTKAMLPPKDAQQFSANWKTLLEVFKSNPPVKSKPAQENSKKEEAHQKPTKDISKKEQIHKKQTKDCLKSNATTTQTNSGKAGKDKAVTSNSLVNGKSQVPSETKQPNAKKRKQDSTQADSSRKAAKKKKVEEVEEKKTTEEDLWFDDVDPDDIEATVGTEAADVMRKKQGIKKTTPEDTEKALVKDRAFEGVTKAVAMDCEMVGVGPDGEDSIVARVSLVNLFGKCIYDKHVKPTEKVTDYRTAVSGIRPDDIKNGENVKTVQREVAEILQGRLLVGHAIHNDLKILLLDHPKKKIRDTQKYKPFKRAVKSGRPSLKVLCREILNVKVQQGEHSSVQDAQATMRLYTMVKKHWEAEIKASRKNNDITKKERKPKSPKNKLS